LAVANECLLQASSSCSEDQLQARLAAFGQLAWCNSVDSGRFLVRFLCPDSLEAAVKSLHGSSWLGEPFSIVGQLLSAGQQDR
jgi:hypothetical protein